MNISYRSQSCEKTRRCENGTLERDEERGTWSLLGKEVKVYFTLWL